MLMMRCFIARRDGELQRRMEACKLVLHPDKTKIVYCKDSNRQGKHQWISFDFLGFTFRPRKAMSKQGQVFTSFIPAIGRKALKRIGTMIKKWKIQRWSGYDAHEIAYALNPRIMGWFNYFKHFGNSELYQLVRKLDFALVRWARKKYKKLGRSYRRSAAFLGRLQQQNPGLFAHWHTLAKG